MPSVTKLRLRQFVPPGGCFHVARIRYPAGGVCRLHRHDFCEICWIESGRALHLINGQRQALATGELTWIRPDDAHGYRTIAGRGFTLVNLAFDASVMTHMCDRYFADRADWPWAGDVMPAQRALSVDQQAQLMHDVDGLSMRRQSRLDLEWFILGLMRSFEARAMPDETFHDVPPWLARALTEYVEAGAYERGPRDLAKAAGRSMEHINRVVRQCYGRTTTELLNGLRLDRASKLLRMTGEPILQVAMQCGFNNLGYFYRQFERRFQMTPRRYRLKMHAVIR